MLRRPLQALFTFPDANGRRWSTWRLLRTQHHHQSALLRGLVLVSICFQGLMLVGFLGGMIWVYTHPDADAQVRAMVGRNIGHFLLTLAVGAMLVSIILRVYVRRDIRRLLKKDICPACGYSLAGLDPSNPITCPECGAVWNRQLNEKPAA